MLVSKTLRSEFFSKSPAEASDAPRERSYVIKLLGRWKGSGRERNAIARRHNLTVKLLWNEKQKTSGCRVRLSSRLRVLFCAGTGHWNTDKLRAGTQCRTELRKQNRMKILFTTELQQIPISFFKEKGPSLQKKAFQI